MHAGGIIMKIEKESNHEHCYHSFRGPIHVVVPEGHVVEKCCKCHSTRVIHVDHLTEKHDWRRLQRWA